MKKTSKIGKLFFAISILTMCVCIFLAKYSFGLGYYGTHHGQGGYHGSFRHHGGLGHHGGHHGSFGHHSSFRHHGNRLHSSLYNHHDNGLYSQHDGYGYHDRYNHHNTYGPYIFSITPSIIGNHNISYAQNSQHLYDEYNEDTYEYAHKEPYIFVYGKEYNPGADTYVFQYEQGTKKESGSYAYNKSN